MFRSINELAGQDPWLDALGVFSAKPLIFIMAAAIAAASLLACWKGGLLDRPPGWWRRLRAFIRRPRSVTEAEVTASAAVRAALAAIAAYLANFLFSLAYFRPRPCAELLEVHKLIERSCLDKSFPSDHASLAFAMAFSVIFVRPLLGSALLVAAAFVAWGRVFVGVHYPIDVAAGALVGLFWALVIRAVDSRFGLTGTVLRLWSKLRARLKLDI